MEFENRISFDKEYSEIEKIIIDTRIDDILQEFKTLEIGPSAFKLSEEITCIYCIQNFSESNKEYGFVFEYEDYNTTADKSVGRIYNTYYAKSLFIKKYKKELKEMLNNEKEDLDIGDEEDFFYFSTCEELKILIQNGYGYNVYNSDRVKEEFRTEINSLIRNKLNCANAPDQTICEIINEWETKNPEKCLFSLWLK